MQTLQGQLPFFIRKTLGLLSKYKFPYNQTIPFRFGEPTYFVACPKDIRYILAINAKNYTKTLTMVSEEGQQREGRGLLTSYGKRHLQQRQLLLPCFRNQVLESFLDTVVLETKQQIQKWQHNLVVDLDKEMADLSLAILLKVLFGTDFVDPDKKMAKAVHERRIYTEYYYHSRLPFHMYLPTKPIRKHASVMNTIDQVIYQAIADKKENPGNDFVSLFLAAKYSDGSKMNDQQVRDEVLTLTSTGYETIGDCLTWCWYLLANNSQADKVFRQEVKANFAKASKISIETFNKLLYTQKVVLESLRIYPTTWVYVRVPQHEDTLPSGTKIPSGAKLYICPYAMHRHPEYFPDPESFLPERFPSSKVPSQWSYVYMPFGLGAHKCLGQHFARLQTTLVLATIANQFQLTMASNQKLIPYAGITLRPKQTFKVKTLKLEK